jgi:hypothetical protein
VLAIFPPGLGIEVRATIEPPPPLGENTAWNIRFEADERPGVKLWVEIGTGNEDEAALYQVAPGGGCEFTEPPPEESFYRARFEWTSPAGDGDYTVDLPVSQQP